MAASAGRGGDTPQYSQDHQRVHFSVAWKQCSVCPRERSPIFKSPRQFCEHLRDFHCTREGGSYICKYGPHGVCLSLPVEGVNDQDYEDHVARDHVAEAMRLGTSSSAASSRSSGSCTENESSTRSEPSVVQDQHKWTMYMSKVNLPAALNDPRLTRRETDFFSKTWGEGFTDRVDVKPSAYLPDISKEHFRKYLKMTMSRLKEHERNASVPNVDENLPPDEFPLLRARRPHQKERFEVETIPKMFMMTNFSLENVDTFNAVFPWSHIESSQAGGGPNRQSSKLLQEKLSHYLDLVEVQIAQQISLRSDAFFHAMTSHDILEEKMKDTCKTIRKLREKIRLLDSRVAQGPIKIIKETRTRANYMMLYNKLKLMSTVHQTQPTIQMLLSSNEYVGALDLIGTTQEVLAQELAGIHSFRHLGSQLAEMEKLIDKMIQGDFVKYVTADLNRPLSEVDKIMEEERLVSIVLGMIRQRKFNLVDVYREEACTTIKATIKQGVVEAVAAAEDIGNDDNVGSLADQMRLLNFPVWMELLETVFANILIVLHRVKAATEIMLDVAQVAAGTGNDDSSEQSNSPTKTESLPNGDLEYPNGANAADIYTNGEENGNDEAKSENGLENSSSTWDQSQKPRERHSSLRMTAPDMDIMITSEEYEKLATNLQAMLVSVTSHAHDRCVKLLTARAKDGFLERLTSGEFVQLSRTIEKFVSDCEGVCGQKSTTLRASLQSQANRFVTRFHEERKTKLTLILDNERWKQAEVPAEFQQLVTHIYTHDRISLPERKLDPDKKTQEYLIVNGEKYAVVGTVLMLLKMMVEYCQCAEDIPTVTTDLLNRVVELLKMFNSRTCQLILGAGALQLVGLKTITTKNLALASRCLQLIIHFIPLIRNHFTNHLSVKQTNMLKHFDSVLKDYNDHVAEIANKLLAIMDSMVEMQLSKWEVKPPMPSASFRSISKQMSKLHEAIVDLLPPKQVFDLFQEIVVSFQIKLRGQLIRLGVTNDGGPQHGLVSADYTFFLENLSSLNGLGKLDDNMDSIWDKR